MHPLSEMLLSDLRPRAFPHFLADYSQHLLNQKGLLPVQNEDPAKCHLKNGTIDLSLPLR